jgi:putative chitinase
LEAFELFEISTPKRQASFLAQVSIESENLHALEENLNYSAKGLLATFPTHFHGVDIAAYARKPEKIANRVYANRLGNGNEASGDGWKFHGRGLIQVTFKDNYRASGEALKLDLLANPELLAEPKYAAQSAGWFWKTHGCNELADHGEFKLETRRINGGLNGEAAREAAWAKIREAIPGS